ncbi:2-phospho-L-lactate guanylyltransferase [Geodermatophilus sp. DF01-2]|uniref:2-phospho-L-lactate guanylyltransferase n=1 Tax=Geodermatophilus sp. DF01-2 TaxID=2559610 RepID=UPI00107453CB|nr:2-phospho-L-lactate guanylyltransferase [Geodermatophilus sp. DF01_2]TFV61749.1 2-phospho-L-lactate guanylyltransferase [Geodermatophilus sp. DF01_2]
MGAVRAWSVVVPAKRLPLAKTRLTPLTDGLGGPPGAAHARLVLALLADTVAAALACPAVAGVLVVTDDTAAGEVVTRLGARTVPDEPDRGLNPALAHGARATGSTAVAALSSDLPALRPEELTAALAAAEARVGGRGGRCFVADAQGTGTTLLTAVATDLSPAFGAGSAQRHAAGGAVELPGTWPGLARDVDTAEDLRAALALGVGTHTAAVLGGARPRTG